MTITANSGPYISFGQLPTPTPTGVPMDYNPNAGPNLWYQGDAILDPRFPFCYQPGDAVTDATGWSTTTAVVMNQIPSTASTTSIAAAQVPVAGTPLTLVSATGAGITVGQTITNSATGTNVSGLLVIDGAVAQIAFGQSGGPNIWDPTKACSRTVQVTSVGNDSAATVTIKGFDIYWYPMTQTLTLSNASVATTTKAFKYIQSITPAGTLSGSNVSVGHADTIGFPLRVDFQSFADIYWPQPALIGSATGFTAAVTTSPATALTGDVRGTYALQSASDGTKRMIMFIAPSPNVLGTTAGLLGVNQF